VVTSRRASRWKGQGDREVHQGSGIRVQAAIQENQVRVTGKTGMISRL